MRRAAESPLLLKCYNLVINDARDVRKMVHPPFSCMGNSNMTARGPGEDAGRTFRLQGRRGGLPGPGCGWEGTRWRALSTLHRVAAPAQPPRSQRRVHATVAPLITAWEELPPGIQTVFSAGSKRCPDQVGPQTPPELGEGTKKSGKIRNWGRTTARAQRGPGKK